MNHSIVTADRRTHLKIVVVALLAAITVATVGIAARWSSDIELAGHPASSATAGVHKPGKPFVWTSQEGGAIR